VSVMNTSSIALDGKIRLVNSPNSLPPPPASHGAGLSVLPTDLASAVTHRKVPVVLGKSGVEEVGIFEDIRGVLLVQRQLGHRELTL
jgi:hypothetical protein